MDFRKPGFRDSACGDHSLKIKKEQKNIQKQTRDSRYIYHNKLDESCFKHDMAYGDFKDLNRRIFADKLLSERVLILLKIQNMMDISGDLLQ